MLCGKMPFDGDFKETLKKNRECKVDYALLGKAVPEAVELCKLLLSENPV